jgi:hypothetical protein
MIAGGCHCGNVVLELELAEAPATYVPRACDCDFCTAHGAAYISDPRGSLAVKIRSRGELGTYRQGSGAAEFLVCRTCGVLLAASYVDAGRRYASVNSKAVRATFGTATPVSPKTLAAPDKIERWKRLWFADVTLQDL